MRRFLKALVNLIQHARPWISRPGPDAPTYYGIEIEIDWTDPHPPTPPQISQAANTAATPSTKTKSNNE